MTQLSSKAPGLGESPHVISKCMKYRGDSPRGPLEDFARQVHTDEIVIFGDGRKRLALPCSAHVPGSVSTTARRFKKGRGLLRQSRFGPAYSPQEESRRTKELASQELANYLLPGSLVLYLHPALSVRR